MDFSNLFVTLQDSADGVAHSTLAAAQEAGAVTLNYGLFLNATISFIIVAFAVFLLIRAINSASKEEEEAPAEPTTKECQHCCSEVPIKATKCGHCTSSL